VDWGTVPAWVGAIGTVAAFAVTFALLLHEIGVRRDEASDQEKRQARFVWMGGVGGMGTSGTPGQSDHVDVVVQPIVHNDSDQPIRDVFVEVYDAHGEHLGNTGTPGGIKPGGEAKSHLKVSVPASRDLGDRTTSGELFFTDADGRRWKKSRDQTLSRQLKD
jgi:hypothetical protein